MYSGPKKFEELARLCERLASTTKRTEKVNMIVSFLRDLNPEEVPHATLLIVGKVLPESEELDLDVGGVTIGKVLDAAKQSTLLGGSLTITEVAEVLRKIAEASGPDSRYKKRSLLEGLIARASSLEVKWLVRSIIGEMQHGVNEGVMLEAIAEASGCDIDAVRRADMFIGNIGELARVAVTKGRDGLRSVSLTMFRPIKPMLAEMAYSIEEALLEHGGKTAFEFKLDGARIQIHKDGRRVTIFSRRLSDVTVSVPDIVDTILSSIKPRSVIVEGEVIAIGGGGKPMPFQDLMRRFRRIKDVEELVREIPLKLKLFDVIYVNGKTLLDQSYDYRWSVLEEIVDKELLVERIVTSEVERAKDFLNKSIDSGHEGIMAKSLSSEYTPGRRGKKWLKIKPADTLDVVIIAAEWGHGRRVGWLSNYHLAVIDDEKGGFTPVGKTFKGLTDEEFEIMTRRLLDIKIHEDGYTVYVKPNIVVEVAYNEIQRSPHYPSGYALRFARITKIREDKSPQDVDNLSRLRYLYRKQLEKKARTFDKNL